MKRHTLILIMLVAFASLGAQSQKTLHDFKTTDIWGDTFDFADLKGKKVLIVNTASECKFTGQFEGMQALYEKYGGDNFIIIGFPSASFDQELSSDEEIAQFCTVNYGVTFPMMTESHVKGDDINPIFKWLTQKSLNGRTDVEIKWNFQKFMVDENGQLAGYAEPDKMPQSEEIVNWITGRD